MKYIYEAIPSTKENESGIYRSCHCKDSELVKYHPKFDASNAVELIQESVRLYKDADIIGYRNVLETYKEEKQIKVSGSNGTKTKTFTYNKFSGYNWLSYSQVSEILECLSGAFGHLGLTNQKKVGFYAPASYQWLLLAYGLFYQNAVVATVYDTLGEEGLLHGINQCESPALFLTAEQLPTLRKICDKVEHLKIVIYTGNLPENTQLDSEFPNLKCYSWDELLELGKQNPCSIIQPKPEDLAVIMYTSGSTGAPKGVLISHSQIVATIAGGDRILGCGFDSDDIFISFLPMAHILAFMLNFSLFTYGVKIGFATPRTLMDNSVRNCRGDLCELKPTLIAGVPQIYDTIRKGVMNKIKSAGPVMNSIFEFACILKKFMLGVGLPTGILDGLVFKALADSTGGRLRLGISGGAPLSADVSDFFSTTLFPVIQGYGMTEMCGLGSVVPFNDTSVSSTSVGVLNPTMEIKLVDVPEAGYFHSDMTGELWARGNNVTNGYFKNTEATNEAITDDGWLKTGDIVRIDQDGSVSIIDRLKNLVKLSNGEYIALERLESIYRNCEYVQSICLLANSHLRYPVAIIQPNLPALQSLAAKLGKDKPQFGTEFDDDLTKNVFDALIEEANRGKLISSEKIAALHISSEEFSAENNLLTASQKLNRRGIQNHFKSQLEVMYKKAE